MTTTLELATSRGVASVTTAALARRLGFTEAALYRYFPGKDAILAAALQHTAEELFASMVQELTAEQGDEDSGGGAHLRRHLRRFTEHQGILLELLLVASANRGGELQEAGNAFLQEYFHRLMVYFQQLEESDPGASSAQPRELTSLWICQLLGGFVRSRLTVERWDPEAQDGFRAFLTRLGRRPALAL